MSDNLNKAVEEILHHLTNQAYYSDADYAEATKAIKTLLIQSKIDELERLIHPGWSGKIPENAATMLISHHDVEKQLAKLKEELEP